MGKFEVLGKYAKATFREGGALEDYDQDTTEFNLNYVIKEFNARLMFFVINTDFSAVKTERNAGRRRPAASDVGTPLTTRSQA